MAYLAISRSIARRKVLQQLANLARERRSRKMRSCYPLLDRLAMTDLSGHDLSLQFQDAHSIATHDGTRSLLIFTKCRVHSS